MFKKAEFLTFALNFMSAISFMEHFHERFTLRSRVYLLKYTVYMFIGIIYPPSPILRTLITII